MLKESEINITLKNDNMKLFDYIDKTLLDNQIYNGYISVSKHPIYDLYIYNYTKQCIFDKSWNEATEKCRGLIVDGNYTKSCQMNPSFQTQILKCMINSMEVLV